MNSVIDLFKNFPGFFPNHKSSPKFILGCCSIFALFVSITVLNQLSTHFESLDEKWYIIILVLISILYILYVVFPRLGSKNRVNIYIMTVSRKALNQGICYDFSKKVSSYYEKKSNNICHPSFLHRLFFNAVFSQNLFGSKFIGFYRNLYRKISKEGVFIYGDLTEDTDKSKDCSSAYVNLYCLKMHKFNTEFENQIGLFWITASSMSSIEFIHIVSLTCMYIELLNTIIEINSKDDFIVIRHHLEKISNWEHLDKIWQYQSSVVFQICNAVSEILIDISHTNKLTCDSSEYLSLCKFIFDTNPETLKTGLLPCYQYHAVNVIMTENLNEKSLKDKATKILELSNNIEIPSDNSNCCVMKANKAFLSLLAGNTEIATNLYNDLFSNPIPASTEIDVYNFFNDASNNQSLADYAKYGLALFYFNKCGPGYQAMAMALFEEIKRSRTSHLRKAAKQIIKSMKGK